MQLSDFIKKFRELKTKGFIPSTRSGPTGIGHTLETSLGLRENNIALPDLVEAEIKAHRGAINSMITLFTFNNKVWKISPLKAVKKYGSLDKNGRKGLYYTMSLKPNSAGLFLHVTNNYISVRHISGDIIAVWDLKMLADLRLHDKGTMARNHGTGFRTYENKLQNLFTSTVDL